MRWFRGTTDTQAKPESAGKGGQRVSRRSTGFAEFMRTLTGIDDLTVLDLGPTSSANISYLTQFGGRVYTENLLRTSRDPSYLSKQEDGTEKLDPQKFFAENLNHPEGLFDAVLCWDVADYLDEALVKPAVERIHKSMKPKGVLLAFFHTKDAGPESPYCRYHILNKETVELEPGPDFRLQRIFNNRHVENLFKEFSSLKFFLGKDNIREVLVVR